MRPKMSNVSQYNYRSAIIFEYGILYFKAKKTTIEKALCLESRMKKRFSDNKPAFINVCSFIRNI